MKMKFMKRFSSAILALVMLVALAIPAYATGTTKVYWEVSTGKTGGPKIPDVVYSATNCPNSPTTVSAGDDISIPWPASTEATEKDATGYNKREWTFSHVRIMYLDSENSIHELMFYKAEDCALYKVPDDVGSMLMIDYAWSHGDWVESTSPTLTNFIFSVDRTVAQGGSDLTPKQNDAGTDVYIVKEDQSGMKSGLTLSYNTSMNMENLKLTGFDIPPASGTAWQMLKDYARYITNDTKVDLHFTFDDHVIMSSLDTSNATLTSDMFVLEDEDPFEVNVNGKELIVHCRWDSENAMENKADKKGDLNPMIEFNGIKIGLIGDWGDADSITVQGVGEVKGTMIAKGDTNNDGNLEIDFAWEIDGGDATDEFILVTSEKTSLPHLEKKIETVDEGGDTILVDQDDVAAGDTVKFQLISNVPENLKDFITYPETEEPSVISPLALGDADEEYTLTFHDVMNEQLALNEDSFEVTVGGKTLDEAYYEIHFASTGKVTDGCTFEVLVYLDDMYNNDVITEDNLGVTSIVVTYTATLDENAEAGTYQNKAWVSYPEDETEKDTVEVDTYGIEIFKYDQADETKGLAGAKFALYGADAVNKDEDGNVTLISGVAPIKDNISSGNDGKVTIEGLDAGTYYLVETDAPTGYVKNSTPLEIVIPDDAGDDCWVRVKFANSEIPGTGGTGTMMFTIGGAAILAAAGALFVISRRPRKEQEF